MHWITPGVETYLALGTCVGLFGLLVFSVKQRSAARRSLHSLYGSAPRPNRATAARRKSPEPSRAVPRVQPAKNTFCTGSTRTAAERSDRATAPDSSSRGGEALETLSAQISREVKMNSPSSSSESLGSVMLPAVSAAGAMESIAVKNDQASSRALEPCSSESAGDALSVCVAMLPQPGDGCSPEISDIAEQSGAQPVRPENAIAASSQASPAAAPLNAPRENASADFLKFFGLKQQPFDVTPDPAYLFPSASHSEALTSLKQGIEHFRGFMTLVAEPGMGKTTVLNRLMDDLAESARVVFVFQTQCTSRELLSYILNELEVDHAGMDVVAMHRALNQALLEEMLRGRRFVLIVDEAQNLQEPVLETIRLLSDFETTNSKLIQIVLAGQPQLAETLMIPELVQLRQRIAVLAQLNALNASETAAYIEHRLRAAGWRDTMVFSSEALDQIAESSHGIPRSINHLCFGALLEGFHRGMEVIDADLVRDVAAKLNLESVARQSQSSRAPRALPASADSFDASQLARVLAAALASQAEAQEAATAKQASRAVLAGSLTEKVRSQGWSKKHNEYRILISLERDPFSGLPVAERYYCASLYVDEAQAAALEVGKPVRLKIEQD